MRLLLGEWIETRGGKGDGIEMTPFGILSFVATGIVFLMWAFSVFRTLFAMRKRAVARSGSPFPSLSAALNEVAHWLRTPTFKQERRQLLWMTSVVLMLSALISITTFTSG